MRKASNSGNRRGITSSSRNPVEKLPLRKRVYVKARSEGKNLSDAAAEAGVGPAAGRRYDKEADVQAAYRALVQKAIPATKLVRLIKGGCEAKMPVFNDKGKKITERADWKTRKPYIDMAAKHGGYYVDTSQSNNSLSITFSVTHIGQSPTLDASNQRIIQSTTKAIAITEPV